MLKNRESKVIFCIFRPLENTVNSTSLTRERTKSRQLLKRRKQLFFHVTYMSLFGTNLSWEREKRINCVFSRKNLLWHPNETFTCDYWPRLICDQSDALSHEPRSFEGQSSTCFMCHVLSHVPNALIQVASTCDWKPQKTFFPDWTNPPSQ